MVIVTDDEGGKREIASQPGVVLMFVANWCGSCRLFKPKFEKISNKPEYQALHFLLINAEECPELRRMAQVNALPYFATFHRGQILDSGATLREEQVIHFVKNLIGQS